MENISREVARMSFDVLAVEAAGERLAVLARSLESLIASDLTGWVDLGPPTHSLTIITTNGPERPEVIAALTRNADIHPVIRAMRDRPWSESPMRMSDLIPVEAWLRHPVYNDAFRMMETKFQLVIPVMPLKAGRVRAWVFNRSGVDFGTNELSLGSALQPLLAAVNRTAAVQAPHVDAGLIDRSGLTSREAEVLTLLASGLSARQIATVIRVSPGTVNKHVQHVYEKLQVHDRVSAVLLASGRRPDTRLERSLISQGSFATPARSDAV